MRKGLPDPADPIVPRAPVDRVAARVIGGGEVFSGFSVNTEELCSPAPMPMREFVQNNTLPDYRGMTCGRLTVLGLATIEHNSGYLNRDPLARNKANEQRSLKNYKGVNPQKRPTKKTGDARWVCRCACGNYTLRSTRGIRINSQRMDSETPDACVQCRQLYKLKNKLGRYA